MTLNAELLMLVGGVSSFCLTLYWVRSRALSEKYAAAWMLVATALLVCGVFPNLIKDFATSAHLAYPTAVLFLSAAGIFCFLFFGVGSLTRQVPPNNRLEEELGFVENRLAAVGVGKEEKDSPRPAAPALARR